MRMKTANFVENRVIALQLYTFTYNLQLVTSFLNHENITDI